MAKVAFQARISAIGSMTIFRLPTEVSAKLPSRGMVLIEGTINDRPLKAVLEPDGRGSHWFKVEKSLGLKAGDSVELSIETSKDWPEPELPDDVLKALRADPEGQRLWDDITPMARWDWLRWINSTGVAETRARRVEAALSKLKGGTRRPCCFNRSMCTDPSVSKSGVLLEPVT